LLIPIVAYAEDDRELSAKIGLVQCTDKVREQREKCELWFRSNALKNSSQSYFKIT